MLSIRIKYEDFLFNIIFILLLIGMFYSYVGVQWSDIEGSIAYAALGKTDIITVSIKLTVILCLVLLSRRLYLVYRGEFPYILSICLIILIVFVVFWTILSFSEIGLKDSLFKASSPLIYLSILAVYLGYDSSLWNKLAKYSLWIACVFIILSIIVFFQFKAQYPFGLPGGNSHVLSYFITGFWFLAISTINVKDNIIYKVLTTVLIFSCLLLAVVMYSRGWILQCVFLLLFRYRALVLSRNLVTKIRISIVLSVILLLAYVTLRQYFEFYLELLIGKIGVDTRSTQYVELFRQVPLKDLILGNGINASYYLTGYLEYEYFDNQFIFTAFHYGIFLTLAYSLFFVYPLFKSLNTKGNIPARNCAFVLVLWLFAIGGLSVYNGIGLDIKSILVSMAAGRNLFLLSKAQ